jgi:solute carrier family 10 (sodium/bile acid cotransporter), member 7
LWEALSQESTVEQQQLESCPLLLHHKQKALCSPYTTIMSDVLHPTCYDDDIVVANPDKSTISDPSIEVIPTFTTSDASELRIPDAATPHPTSCIQKALTFYFTNQFPIHILVAIALARAYPQLGPNYLATEYTASWLAVAIIFFISGLGLQVKDFLHTISQVKFNATVQIFNFCFMSAVVFGVSQVLTATHALTDALADGLVIGSCVPMAINAVIVLSAATGADEAAAVFNATLGNIVGIFLSPVIILMYVGTKGEVPMGEVFYKLVLRVVVPLCVGQCLQYTIPSIKPFFVRCKRVFKRTSESCLVFIIYAVFCTTFTDANSAGLAEVFKMMAYLLILSIFFMVTSWYLFQYLFRNEPELRVTGFMGCSQKTVALGVPLIHSIYAGSPNEGLYTLPILIWHPMMLVLSSMLIPRMSKFIQEERKRLDAERDRVVAPTDTKISSTTKSSTHHSASSGAATSVAEDDVA